MSTLTIQEQLKVAVDEERKGNYTNAQRLAEQVLLDLDAVTTSQDLIEEEDALTALRAEATRLLAMVAWRRGNNNRALEYLNVALTLAESSGEKSLRAKTMNNIGQVYDSLSDYQKALEYFALALSQHQEVGNGTGMALVNSNIGNVYMGQSDYTKALQFYERALSQHEEIGDNLGVATVTGNIGGVHLSLSDYPKALDYFERALSQHEKNGTKAFVAIVTGSIGNVYVALSDYHKALEYYERALSMHEEIGDKVGEARVIGNIGNVYYALSDYPKALEYNERALKKHQDVDNLASAAGVTANLGNVYFSLSDYPRALECYTRALLSHEELGDKKGMSIVTGNMGVLHEELGDYARAVEYYSRSLQLHEDLGAKSEAAVVRGNIGGLYASTEFPERDEAKAEEYMLESIAVGQELGTKRYEALQGLAELYEQQGRWQESNNQWKKYYELREMVQSEEARKSAVLMEQRRQVAEREKEIAIAKAVSDAQMSATTKLLYKVLPQSVATRMIDGEEEIADYFTSVSILFADIAGFTPISADMPAIIVVRFLNYVFGEFDRIMKKHGCEKIKTIGDGYMAVAGAPTECADHAERLAAAALEMQEAINLPESIREHMPKGVKLGIRIGLHTGSVVAGVIGEERFVYDIYSDAVNTAARMESHGEENKIHCSNDFYRHLQNRFAMTKDTTHGLVFEKRGEMEIKGKGMMKTYFLGHSK